MKSGLILFNKQPGVTSFDALRDIKRALNTGKVGHTGTLDKFAQGLLIVLTGKALKLSQWFSNCDKKYTGKIKFGAETDTLDPEGNVIAEAALPSREKVEEVISAFTGNILQEPPVYSAIHINGKRASSLARAGQLPEMKKREVVIHKLELINWQPPFAEIFVHCSSGTYIRSLARDIALAAGSRAHLCGLFRTQVAGFELDLKEFPLEVHPIDKSVIEKLGMPWIEIEQNEVKHIIHGKPLGLILNKKQIITSAPLRLCEISSSEQIIALFCDETLIAIVEKLNGNWKYCCVM